MSYLADKWGWATYLGLEHLDSEAGIKGENLVLHTELHVKGRLESNLQVLESQMNYNVSIKA